MMRIMLTLAAVLTALTVLGARAGDDDVESGTTGTGIMGVITGLGSIHVNGLNIEIPAGLAAQSSLGPRPAGTLQVGETVVLEAALTGGALTATRVRSYYPVIAPVDAVGPGRISVLGLDLDVAELAVPALRPGDWIAVSGLWRGPNVAVSHIRRIDGRAQVVVNGAYSEAADGTQRVGAFALDGQYVAHAEPGDHLRVTGAWAPRAGTLAPTRIEVGLFSRTLETLLIEGYLSEPDRQGAYSIYGSGIVVYTDDPNMQVPEGRNLFCVRQEDQVTITRQLALGTDRARRMRLLETLTKQGGGAQTGPEACGPLP